jgi:hypothetical protein
MFVTLIKYIIHYQFNKRKIKLESILAIVIGAYAKRTLFEEEDAIACSSLE